MGDLDGLLALLESSPIHSRYTAGSIRRWFAVPASLGQLAVYRDPIDWGLRGVATWAWFSEDAERRFLAQQPLTIADWRSGDRLWFIDLVAPHGDAKDFIRQLQADPRFAHARSARWGRTFGTGRFQKIGVARRGVPQAPGAPGSTASGAA